MNGKVSSRVWLVTGCSTGFGRHLAEALLAQGSRVIVTARQVERIRDLEQKYPETAKSLHLDVTDKKSIEEAVNIGLKIFGTIDVVVNNAGYGLRGAVEEASDEQCHHQFETNYFGVLNVLRCVLPILREKKAGHILNISSVGGRLTVPYLGHYHASKFALEGMSEVLAYEVKPFGIKVTIIEPGGFETDFWGRSIIAAEPMPEYDVLREQMEKYVSGSIRGDAVEGVQAILKVVEMQDPPLRLVIGPNALPRLLQKLNADIEEYKRYENS